MKLKLTYNGNKSLSNPNSVVEFDDIEYAIISLQIKGPDGLINHGLIPVNELAKLEVTVKDYADYDNVKNNIMNQLKVIKDMTGKPWGVESPEEFYGK